MNAPPSDATAARPGPARYCVIGHPVAHSRSPWIHTRFAELLGEALAYDRELAPLDGFAATVQRLRADGVAGCNVTVPFKFEAAALATRLTERARLACACNLLRFDGDAVVGDNTDGWGLVHDITAGAGFDLAGRDLLLVGAGGAAAGVLGPLLGTGLRRIVIVNRSLDRARRLARHHADLAARQNVELQVENPQDLKASFDVVVNATAASLNGAAPPVPNRRCATATAARSSRNLDSSDSLAATRTSASASSTSRRRLSSTATA